MLCRYFLYVCGLSLHFHNGISQRAEVFILILFDLPLLSFMLSFFRALDLEFEPRLVGTTVLPQTSARQVPPESLREYAENTESWVPTLGTLLKWALGSAGDLYM